MADIIDIRDHQPYEVWQCRDCGSQTFVIPCREHNPVCSECGVAVRNLRIEYDYDTPDK